MVETLIQVRVEHLTSPLSLHLWLVVLLFLPKLKIPLNKVHKSHPPLISYGLGAVGNGPIKNTNPLESQVRGYSHDEKWHSAL